MAVHPTAIVDPAARIAETAEIGPYCIIGAEVEIGAGTRLMAHVYVEGPTWIGAHNQFYPYSSIGVASQDLKYKGERAETRIGSRNRIREFVTIYLSISMYFTPAIYLPDWVPAAVRPVLYLNPFSYLTWVYQDVLFFGSVHHPYAWAMLLLLSAGSFFGGVRVFKRIKPFLGNVL